MAFRALRETRLPVRAVAIYSGAYDLHDLLRFRPEFGGLYEALIPGYRQHPRAALDRRSVTMWPDKLPAETGILLFHGDGDERAPVASARRFDEQLRRLGRPHQLVIYPGESHFLDGVRPDLHERTLRWFDRFRVPPAPHRAVGTGQRAGQPRA
jgi:dipeptidyl aminopeptidase/acylaminoacyl peptidase